MARGETDRATDGVSLLVFNYPSGPSCARQLVIEKSGNWKLKTQSAVDPAGWKKSPELSGLRSFSRSKVSSNRFDQLGKMEKCIRHCQPQAEIHLPRQICAKG